MKIPAVALAAAFGGGIVLGLQPQIGSHINSRLFVIPALLGVAVVVCLGLVLMLRERLVAAAILSLGCWVALGLVAARVAERPLAADHVLRRIADGKEEGTTYRAPTLELRTPLRWHGRLRSEPARLPWGYGIEIDLSGVDTAEQFIPVSGGLRLGFTPKEEDARLAGGSRWRRGDGDCAGAPAAGVSRHGRV